MYTCPVCGRSKPKRGKKGNWTWAEMWIHCHRVHLTRLDFPVVIPHYLHIILPVDAKKYFERHGFLRDDEGELVHGGRIVLTRGFRFYVKSGTLLRSELPKGAICVVGGHLVDAGGDI